MGSKAKNWVIVVNNPLDKGFSDYCLGFDEATDVYMICGKERGEKGTPHIQAYVQFKSRWKFERVKKRWPHAHIQVARGSPGDNVAYCSKECSHEHGSLECTSRQGSRNDLKEIKTLVDAGDVERVREEYYGSFIRYRRALLEDFDMHVAPRREPTELHIYWGATGTGKSRKAFEEFPGAYWKPKGDWWDGYAYQQDVVIDEFYGWLPIDLMLRLCDRYPLRVPIKGGFRQFTSKRVIVTSNKSWREWWVCLDERLAAAFERRITYCEEFTV